MRITVDTNVLVSATFWQGDSNEIIERVERKEIELVLSEPIIEEFIRVLGYKEIQDKIKNKNLKMKRTVEKIVSISVMVEPIECQNSTISMSGGSEPTTPLTCGILSMLKNHRACRISSYIPPVYDRWFLTKLNAVKDDPDDNKVL